MWAIKMRLYLQNEMFDSKVSQPCAIGKWKAHIISPPSCGWIFTNIGNLILQVHIQAQDTITLEKVSREPVIPALEKCVMKIKSL
jgi:hypothetical protein